jgi:[Skp1-protein]-hydroxyproline N-acetylglucosaminyltransferase
MPGPKIKPDTIFVSIASYRDDVCLSTIKSIFENAAKPENVFLGICQQNKDDEDKDVQDGNESNPNIRTIRLKNYEAKGPTWARYLCATLWNGEEYFMQIDSHTKFVKDWDIKCIKMIKDIQNSGKSKKPLLSHYPREISDHDNYKDSDKQMVPRMCKAFWNNRGMLSFMGAETQDTKNEPYQTPYIAGGFIFSPYEYLLEVPYDPNLPYLFVGEEILHSLRAYTFGWDVFTPTENIVFHEYTRASKPKIWTDNPYYSDMAAFDKAKYYLGIIKDKNSLKDEVKVNLDKYGLGTARSLKDFFKYTGIDADKQTVSTNFCRPDNKASEEDIKQSNEKNHVKENFILFKNSEYTTGEQIAITVGTILCVIFVIWLISVFKKQSK